jgi:predicted HicB family RNase H-like nuclease
VTGYINPDAHKQLRLLALEQSGSVQELIVEALNDLFRKHGKPQIA